MIYLAMNRFPDAIDTFNEVIKKEETKPQLSKQEQSQLYYYLAVAYAQIGELKKAQALLQNILERDPDHARARDLFDQISKYLAK